MKPKYGCESVQAQSKTRLEDSLEAARCWPSRRLVEETSWKRGVGRLAARQSARRGNRIAPFVAPPQSSAVLDRLPRRARSCSRHNDAHSRECRWSEFAEGNAEARSFAYRSFDLLGIEPLLELENQTTDQSQQKRFQANSSAAVGRSRRFDDKKAGREVLNRRIVQKAGSDCRRFARFRAWGKVSRLRVK